MDRIGAVKIAPSTLLHLLHRDETYLERECGLGPFWQKKLQLQQAMLFYIMV